MQPQIFIFVGRSGSGKGTQADLLASYLASHDPDRSIFRLETGWRFREFIKKDTYTARLAKRIYDQGGLMPEFLSIGVWGAALADSFKEDQHLIIDGSPRQISEAYALDSAVSFYGTERPFVICIDLSDEKAAERLLARKRSDDTPADIKRRMGWFDTDVAPVIDYYRHNRGYRFIEVDGDRPVETIHEEIVARIFPKAKPKDKKDAHASR